MKPLATLAAVTIAVSATLAAQPTAVAAQDIEKAVAARQSTMKLYSFYLGQLGAMAKGEVEYDAEAAAKSAQSLNALASLDQSQMWPQGSGVDALGEATRALPAIWTTYPAVSEKAQAFAAASDAMATEAGKDLEALRGAIGAVGKSCGGCHEDFRQPKD